VFFLTSFEMVLRCFSSKAFFSTTSFELKYIKMNLDRYFFLRQMSGNFLYRMEAGSILIIFFGFSFSALVLFYFTVETFFLARLQPLSGPAQLLCSLQMAPSKTLCFPTVSKLCSPFCSLDGPGHVIDPFSTILYHFLVAPSLDCLHSFVGVAHLTCVPLNSLML